MRVSISQFGGPSGRVSDARRGGVTAPAARALRRLIALSLLLFVALRKLLFYAVEFLSCHITFFSDFPICLFCRVLRKITFVFNIGKIFYDK